MYIQQLYTNCLAEAAYYIESNGEAAIIDPLRETKPYLELARQRGTTIRYIFETHFHADFVSGHLDLAHKTGARIVYGPGASAGYEIHVARDGEQFLLGNISIKVLHTPGHTLESSCYLLLDEKQSPYACFTGDTLFIGDVGRPDLAVKSDLSSADLAGMLYDSLHSKILDLPDDVIVYPGHGAGSACGKNIGRETWSTIGMQKQLNYALQPMSRKEFVKVVNDGLTAPPKYFFVDAKINKDGYEPLELVMKKNKRPLSLEEFEKEMLNGTVVLDTRAADVFEKGFIPGSINIGLNGQFAIWVGSLIDVNDAIMLIAEDGMEEEAILRLARIGFENVKGFLKGGFPAWKNSGKQTDEIESIHPAIFDKKYSKDDKILDVRNETEWKNGVLEGAHLVPLVHLQRELSVLDKNGIYYIYCASGYRSMIACSFLKKNGFRKVINLTGGISLMKTTSNHLLVSPALHYAE